MSLKGFKKDDSKKVVDLLNLVATKARFTDLSVGEALQLARLLNFCQTQLIPLMDALVVDELQVRKAVPEEKPAPNKKGSK